MDSKTVVFITGAYVSHHGWNEWKKYLEEKGFKTLAPPWPHKEGTAEELRKKQFHDTDLADLRLPELIEHYTTIISRLQEKPIVIGHSLGGLITQIVLNRGLATAGIVIHSAPPQGVIPFELSFFKAGLKSLGIFTSLKKTYLMSFEKWQYAFTNGMALEEQKAAYNASTIPESKGTLRGTLTSAAKVDFKKAHAPLLFISGSTDTIIPATLNYRNFKKYSHSNSITEYKEFKGKNHFVLGLRTWREEADFILDWINKH